MIFFGFNFFHDVILDLSRNELAKEQMIDTCRYYYRNNLEQLQLIDEFEQDYESDEAIRWYLTKSFLRKMINKALKMKDIDLLYKLRYFIGNLFENLADQHQQIIESGKETFMFYQEIKLPKNKFEKLKENKGKLISMKGFLTITDPHLSSSVSTTKTTRQTTNLVTVLFQIECNLYELGNNFIFTNINECSIQDDILFDLNATFRLENIEKYEEIWIIKMIAISQGRTILEKYIDDTRRQMEILSLPIIFGRLMIDMSQWDQSRNYFEHLKIDFDGEDLAWIEHAIGECYQWKGEWNQARIYYDRSYDRMMKIEPISMKNIAHLLHSIGEVLNYEGKFEEAHDFHQRALTIRKKYYSSDHAQIAYSLDNVAYVHHQRSKLDEALDYDQQAWKIREIYYNYSHFDVAISLANIACIMFGQGKYQEALDNSVQVIAIFEKWYPSGHVYMATALANMANILIRQEKYDEALNVLQRALSIQKKYYPSGHVDVAGTLMCIGIIKCQRGKYDEALDLSQQALDIQTKYCFSRSYEHYF